MNKAPSPQQLLVVDDSAAERALIAHTLRAAFPGAEISLVQDPLRVVPLCEESTFDCVLLDYNMPELDGLSLARRLRAAHPNLPIVLVTSVGDEMLVAEALRSGVSDYIPKGRIGIESLRRIVGGAILACSQKQLIDTQRSELEYFAFALAHDFKQPIRQIITFSELVSEALTADGNDDTRRRLAFLRDAAERLDRLVDVMGQYTLLNQPADLEAVDLERVIAAVRASLSTYLTERGGEFLTPARLPAVHGNETLMIQVLENLVLNGLKYNQSPAPRVELTIVQGASSVAMVVRDNGIGIEPDYLKEIFKPLVRLHTSAQYAGSGLGLTLARKAVMAQAGDIWCDSAPGEGSAFHVTLPAATS